MKQAWIPAVAITGIALAVPATVSLLKAPSNPPVLLDQPMTRAVAQHDATQSTIQPQAQPETRPRAADDDFIRFGLKEAPLKHAGAIRLATYNVENLFDDIDDPDLSGRNEDIDDAKPQTQLEGLSEAIHALDADILVVEELESKAVLTWFRDTYLSDMGYTSLASVDAGDARGIEQGVLSRYPIVSVTNWPHKPLGGTHPEKWGNSDNWHAGEPIEFHRSPLRVVVEIPSGDARPYRLTLFAVHEKSGRYGDYWREAESRGLVEILKQTLEADPDANIAVLGDFNAQIDDESVRTLLDAGLTDVFAGQDLTTSATKTHESGRRIDLILVNDNLKAEVVPESAFVLGTPALPEGMDWRDPWRPEGYASDHFPVAVDIIPHESAGTSGDSPSQPALR